MSLARIAVVKSPLGEKLLLRSMFGQEELGRPFRYELELVAEDPDIDFGAVLGQTMTVELELPDGKTREFTGHVTEFSLAGGSGHAVLYRALLRPWLELLSHRSNCRIFQRQTVPDVIKQVFRDHGFSDFEERLTETYRNWDYLVQYRESDFAFVSRMLEQEGIYYFVKHVGGSHVLVLCDSHGAHEAAPGYEQIPYLPPGQPQREREHIDSWRLTRQIKPGHVASSDFDFTRPRSSLLARRAEPDESVGAPYEDYDYPGEYLKSDEGEKEVRIRLEAHHAGREVAEGSANAGGIAVGSSFTLTDFPRSDQNKEYLVVRTNFQIQVNTEESGIGHGPPGFRCQFSAIDAARPFRAARATPRPVVEGPQTAIVVGPAGEEVFTDEYARVKVKFHWDRSSTGDENSSCWVRVAQVWAGTNFGGIHIPRIGQEVIVDFLEGDPDRPIITGRVYNFENQPPYDLPANQTQSGIKSHSSKGGSTSNFNELRFEDARGSEEVFLQAEKNLVVLVKNDERRDVEANRTAQIGAEDSETVGGSQRVNIGVNQSIVVALARSIIAAAETLTVGTRVKQVATNESTSVGASRSETVGRSETIAIGKDQILTVGGKRSQSVDKDDTLSIAGQRTTNVTKEDHLQVGKRLVITAADEIVLEAGAARLIMKKNGDILLEGKNVQVNGSGKINVKASSDVVLKGSKVTSN